MKRSRRMAINKYSLVIALIVASVFFLSIGFAELSSTNKIEDIQAAVKPQASARITNFLLHEVNNGAVDNSKNYNVSDVFGTIELPNENSTITYKVDVTVFLASEMKITNISGLNENLEYEFTDYTIGDTLCNVHNECNLGATDEFYITIKYKNGSYDGVNTSFNFHMHFTFAAVDYTAKIGNRYYNTLQAAINAVPTNGTLTTVTLLKDNAEKITTKSGQNINLNLQSFTLSNNGTNNVIVNYATLRLSNGIISSDTTQGAINNESGSKLIMTGGKIITTGSRQAIYNNGGEVTISDNAYLSSSSNQRGTVHNLNNGKVTVLGGTIISTAYRGIDNVSGSLTIGTKDGTSHADSPIIRGYVYGVYSTINYNYYDGTILGKTSPTNDNTYIADIETGYEFLEGTEIISAVTYQSLHQAILVDVTLDANGGTVDDPNRRVEINKPIGTLPVPTRANHIFDGWYTLAEGGDEVHSDTVITKTESFFAHWTHEDDIVVAEIGNTTYKALQSAVNAVPTTGVSTTIKLLRRTSENITVAARKNIILDLDGNTLSNVGNSAVINNSGTLKIINGIISTNASTYSAIDNKKSGKLTISSGRIIATGGRQAIYNDGGTVTIEGTAYLSSQATERATVQNLSSGIMNITGGTIISAHQQAVNNVSGTLTIGAKDGNINVQMPSTQGATYGVTNASVFKYYDGILKGHTAAISGDINETEDNANLINVIDVIDNVTYHCVYLS